MNRAQPETPIDIFATPEPRQATTQAVTAYTELRATSTEATPGLKDGILRIVARTTGYDQADLDLDYELEADLGIVGAGAAGLAIASQYVARPTPLPFLNSVPRNRFASRPGSADALSRAARRQRRARRRLARRRVTARCCLALKR